MKSLNDCLMWARLVRWLIFTAAFSVVPLVWCWGILKDTGRLKDLSDLWARGELVLISLTILATALGELISLGSAFKVARSIVGGLSLIYVASACGLYTRVLEGVIIQGDKYDNPLVRSQSEHAFVIALIFGVACMMLSKEAEEERAKKTP